MTCCSQRQLTWGLSGNPRQWATIFCLRCRHVYRRDVPLHEAGIQRDEIEAEMAGREG